MQPGPKRELVLNVSAFLAPKGSVGDQGIDLPHAGSDGVAVRACDAERASPGTVEFDHAVDLMADQRIEIEVGRLAGAKIQGIGCLEKQVIGEQAVHAFLAREPHGCQRRSAFKQWNGGAGNGKGVRHERQTGG
ncbi:hypothetical protein D3C86_1812110 [compost metagenome]